MFQVAMVKNSILLFFMVAALGLLTSCIRTDPEIIKSNIDDRSFAYKKLENGLKVIVVSDPDADKAAASLNVHIGHMADPPNREGLSHFLEHMLFLGTETYPEVGEYGKFVKENGGSTNAGTGMEQTNYFFKIENNSLEPALDQFSRFFIDPLFSPEYVNKEKEAVHSEFSLKTKDEVRRYREAIKQTANPQHPMTQFSVGNLETLGDTESSTILSDVKQHYEQYYSADIMTLAIIGNYPTHDLMMWAEEKFKDIPSKGDTRPANRPIPYLPEQQGVKIYVNSLKEDYSVRLVFALPSALEKHQTKPVAFIARQYRNKNVGGLYDKLKELGWLKYYGVLTWGPDDFSRLQVNIGLTKNGYQHIDEIVDYFFSYTDIIRNEAVTKDRYKELAQIESLKFEYRDKFGVDRLANSLSKNLQYYPPTNALDIGRTFYDFDAGLIKSYMANITPEKARIIIGGQDIKSDIKEERYDVPFYTQAIDAQQIKAWLSPSKINELSLSGKNPYIAENLSLHKTSKAPTPKLGYKQNGISLWYEDENEFELPKAALNIRLYSAQAYSSHAHNVTLRLHSLIMKDLLSAESYNAAQAGLYYYIGNSVRSYNIVIQGYNDKIDVFLEKVLAVFNPSLVDEEVFNRIKQNYLQDLQNQKLARPINQVYAAVSVEGNPVSPSRDAQIKALSDLTFANFLSIAQDLQSSMEIEGIFNGNITQSDVKAIGSMLSDRLTQSLKPNNKLIYTETIIPEGAERFREISVDHNDSALFVMIQGDNDTDKETAMYNLIVQMLRQRFYKSLRTDQQLGYIVQLSDFSYDKIPAMYFAIQSPKAHPATLVEHIDMFLIEQKDYFAVLSAEEFVKNKDGLLSNINKKYDNVYVKGNALNRQIIDGELNFDRRKRLTQAINQITLDEVRAFYDTDILDPSRRLAGIWSIGNSHRNKPDYDPSLHDLCFKPKCISQVNF